jgi:hypothetical protein
LAPVKEEEEDKKQEVKNTQTYQEENGKWSANTTTTICSGMRKGMMICNDFK